MARPKKPLLPSAVVEDIIEAFANGRSLTKIIDEYQLTNPDITRAAFFRAVTSSPELDSFYTAAQVARCEIFVEEIVDIADSELDPQTARNRMDARRWYASKAKPSRYGDKLEVKVETSVDLSGILERARQRLPRQVNLPALDALQLSKPDNEE